MAESMVVETPIQLNLVRIEPDDYVKDMFWFNLRPAMLRIVLILAITVAVLFTIQREAGTGGLGAAIVLFPLILLARWSNLKQAVKNPLNRELWTSKQYEFDQMTFRSSSATGSISIVPFSNIVKVAFFRGYIFLYLSAGQLYALPKGSFKSDADERKFREVLFKYNLLKSVDQR